MGLLDLFSTTSQKIDGKKTLAGSVALGLAGIVVPALMKMGVQIDTATLAMIFTPIVAWLLNAFRSAFQKFINAKKDAFKEAILEAIKTKELNKEDLQKLGLVSTE